MSQVGAAAWPPPRVPGRARRPATVDATDVYDDGSDEDLQWDGGDEQAEHQRVEAVSWRADVEEQFELGDLC